MFFIIMLNGVFPAKADKMDFSLWFFLNSILFGIGLAMDAFSVSLVRGLVEPEMPAKRKLLIAGTFGIFQTLMPLAGWTFVHLLVERFSVLEKFTPWVALALLVFIGVQMIVESVKQGQEDAEEKEFGFGRLLVMAVATSIDALSVGVTIASLPVLMAFTEAVIIGGVTFVICLFGLKLGALFGTRFRKHAGLIGGIILIGIGLEIFIRGVFF